MTEFEIKLHAYNSGPLIPGIVEHAAQKEGLILATKGTLATYPGCIHWHYKKNKERGTLEITWWPKGKRLWFKVAANRRAAWMDDTIPRLKRSIESKL